MLGLDGRQEEEMRSVREGAPGSWNFERLGRGKREVGAVSDLIIKTVKWRQSLHCPGSDKCTHTLTHTRNSVNFKNCESSGTVAAN